MSKVYYIIYAGKKLGTNYMFSKGKIFTLHQFNGVFFRHCNNVIIVLKKICLKPLSTDDLNKMNDTYKIKDI